MTSRFELKYRDSEISTIYPDIQSVFKIDALGGSLFLESSPGGPVPRLVNPGSDPDYRPAKSSGRGDAHFGERTCCRARRLDDEMSMPAETSPAPPRLFDVLQQAAAERSILWRSSRLA